MPVEIISTVEGLCQAGHGQRERVDEDALCVIQDGPDEAFWAAIFDGRRAWQEGGRHNELATNLDAKTTGQAAAWFAVNAFQKCVQRGLASSPIDVLCAANLHWGEMLVQFGYDLDAPEHLPGCAATVLRIDQERRILKFAHWCDTRIILFSPDGKRFIPTLDNMDRWDRIVLKVACRERARARHESAQGVVRDRLQRAYGSHQPH